MTQHMYRVGDYVYFEVFPSAPYQIRRIDELNKIHNGYVEAKVTCFYRRRDLPLSLLKIADQAERQNQILCRPRRCLLTRHPLESASNGDVKSELKENGLENSHVDQIENCENKTTEGRSAEDIKKTSRSFGFAGLPSGADKLPPEEVHALRQRELFLSRQSELLPATQIRGKCAVVILSEIETCDMYLDKEDAFFYSLVYDPTNQTLLADKGKIEIGERYQAIIPKLISNISVESSTGNGNNNNHHSIEDDNKENGELMMVDDEEENNELKQECKKLDYNPGIPVTDRESVVYHPHHKLTDTDIDQFLIIARAVGTFSRALDSSSTMKLPSLHMTASAASRDVTLLHAMALLHQANYDIGRATKFLVPPPDREHYPLEADKVTGHHTINLGGPILCRDQLEEWSAAEATLFEDAIEKYGKDFHDIRVDCLPWKSVRDIVEYYYMWKTTARYTEMQKNKLAEQEKSLKQVYIPYYNKPSPNLVGPQNLTGEIVKSNTRCESCETFESSQWYSWGPSHLHLRLCNNCWLIWRKRGGLKCEHEYENYDLDGISEPPFQSQQTPSINTTCFNQQNTQRNANAGNNKQVSTTAPTTNNRSNSNSTTSTTLNVNNRSVNIKQPNHLPTSNLHITPNQSQNQLLIGTRGRVTFFLNTTLQARIARRMAPKHVLNIKKAARTPFNLIDGKAIQIYYFSRSIKEVERVAHQVRRNGMSASVLEYLKRLHSKNSPLGDNAFVSALSGVLDRR